jgi:hypothetical protein
MLDGFGAFRCCHRNCDCKNYRFLIMNEEFMIMKLLQAQPNAAARFSIVVFYIVYFI